MTVEKLKDFLAIVKKYHFWALILLVVLVGFGTWFSASANLIDEFEQNVSTIDSKVSGLRAVVQKDPHPNEEAIQSEQQVTAALRTKVHSTWRELRKRQQAQVLSWPKELQRDFLQMIAARGFGDEIALTYRDRYQNYVEKRFKELPEIVDARLVEENDQGAAAAGISDRFRGPLPGEAGLEGGGDGAGLASEQEYMVEWVDQADIRARFIWQQTPSSLKVWVAQEDLWIYEALLNIVRDTNRLANGPHDAPISTIAALDVGQYAAAGTYTGGRVVRPQLAAGVDPLAGEEPGGGPPPEFTPGGGFGPGEELGGGGPVEAVDTATAEAKALTSGRYLDETDMPIVAEDGPAVVAGEFKRIPIRLTLLMDPTELPRLLVHCANAPLPVEVTQVRINVGDDGSGGGLGDVGFAEGGRIGPGGGDDTSAASVRTRVPVVVQGIINIVNKVDSEKLGLEAGAADAPAAFAPAAGAGAAPAASPPAAAGDDRGAADAGGPAGGDSAGGDSAGGDSDEGAVPGSVPAGDDPAAGAAAEGGPAAGAAP